MDAHQQWRGHSGLGYGNDILRTNDEKSPELGSARGGITFYFGTAMYLSVHTTAFPFGHLLRMNGYISMIVRRNLAGLSLRSSKINLSSART